MTQWIETQKKPAPLASMPTKDEARDYHDTMLFIEVMEDLGLASKKWFDDNLLDLQLDTQMDILNLEDELTKERITSQLREAFSLAAPEGPGSSTLNPTQKFLFSLEQRRGAYHWQGIVGPAMHRWLSQDAPLEAVLGINAQINCWEAVLVAAAQAELLSVDELRTIYEKDEEQAITRAVTDLFMRHEPQLITLRDKEGKESKEKKNEIKVGDVVMFASSEASKIEHVAAVKTANKANYDAIVLYSLWGTSHGESLITGTLGALKTNFPVLRHITLGKG